MILIDVWMDRFVEMLDTYFGPRVWFVGLQGSYGRGEATENSDIDVVVILDELSAWDIQQYHAMLDTLPNRELICGFLSGRDEIMNWEASDLFQFYYDTKPIRGSLEALLLRLDKEAVNKSIQSGVCNIYHGCVHNMLYEKSEEILQGLYKAASFVLQAICFRQTGRYHRHREELRQALQPEEQRILETFHVLKTGGQVHFDEMSEALFNWAKSWIGKIE